VNIKVDYAALESAHSQIRTISAGIDDRLSSLESRLARLHWEGDDRAAYEAHRAQWKSAMQGINHVLQEIGNAVGVARESYLNTERANASAWGGGGR
jgi:6 kDa early secretory antigenic target